MLTLESLGRLIAKKRTGRGIRAAAKEVGVSPATLSRVENGHLPDLENFRKICTWLGVEMSSVVGETTSTRNDDKIRVHFRKERTISRDTAVALAEMILAADRATALWEEDT